MATRKKTTKKKAKDPHPEEELARLQGLLSGGTDLAPIYVLRGAESFFRRAGIEALVEVATKRGDEVCRHDGKDPEFEVSRLLDDLSGGSLFQGARTVVLDRADSLLKKGAVGNSPALVERIGQRLASPDVQGSVILGVESLRADHAVMKAADKAGGVIVGCRKLWDSPPPWDPDPRRTELVQWVMGRARSAKVQLGPDEAVYLAQAVGNDLAGLVDRLGQLKERGGQGLRELVAWESGASPWDVAERLVDGDAARATAGIEALFQKGFQGRDGERTLDRSGLVMMLTSAITGKVRESVAGAEAMAIGESDSSVKQLAGVKGMPAVQQAFLDRVRRRDLGTWRRMLDEAGELERRSRSGAVVDANDLAGLALHWAARRR